MKIPFLIKPSFAIASILFTFAIAYAGNYYDYQYIDKPNSQGYIIATNAQGDGLLDAQGKEVIPFVYKSLELKDDIFVAQNQDTHYGLLDKQGKPITAFNYTNIESFYDDFVRATRVIDGQEKTGFLDKKGKEVIPFVYEKATDFYHGFAFTKLDDRYYLIDKKGKHTPLDTYYNYIDSRNIDGLYQFTLKDENDNEFYGVIDYKGKIIVPPRYCTLYFRDKLIAAQKPNGKYDYYTKDGKPLGESMADDKRYNREGYDDAYIFDKTQDGKELFGVKDALGKVMIEPIYDRINAYAGFYFAEKRDPTAEVIKIYEAGYDQPMDSYDSKSPTETLFDKNGKIIFQQPNVTITKPIKNQKFIITKRLSKDEYGKYGLIDIQGKVLIPIIYDHLQPIGELYRARTGDKVGLVNENNKIVVPFGKYSDIICESDCDKADIPFILVQQEERVGSGGIYEVYKHNGLIDKTGNEILPPIYNNVYIEKPYLIVEKKNKNDHKTLGVFNLNSNNVLLPIAYKSTKLSSTVSHDNLIVKSLDDKFGIIDEQGKFIAQPIYDRITEMNIGDSVVGYTLLKDRHWGVIDDEGNTLSPVAKPLAPINLLEVITNKASDD